jgi:hypothetical protein
MARTSNKRIFELATGTDGPRFAVGIAMGHFAYHAETWGDRDLCDFTCPLRSLSAQGFRVPTVPLTSGMANVLVAALETLPVDWAADVETLRASFVAAVEPMSVKDWIEQILTRPAKKTRAQLIITVTIEQHAFAADQAAAGPVTVPCYHLVLGRAEAWIRV